MDPTEPGNQRAMIANTLSQYAWAYDLDRLEFIDDCFARDAEVDFGDSGTKIGRAAVVDELKRRRAVYSGDETPWHVITNIFIRPLTPTTAMVASWYGFGPMRPGETMTLNRFGWYDDTFTLEDGAWRIAARRVRRVAGFGAGS